MCKLRLESWRGWTGGGYGALVGELYNFVGFKWEGVDGVWTCGKQGGVG